MKTAKILFLVGLLACFAQAAMAADARGGFTRDVRVSGPVELQVSTGSGNVSVRAGETSTVHVVARIHAHDNWFGNDGMSPEEKVKAIEQNPPVKQNGNIVTVGRIEDRALRQNVSIDYDITVPAETRLTSETGSGDQQISGIKGPIRANTGSGNVTLSNTSSEVRLGTGSGDVKLDSIGGDVYAETGSGNVTAQHVTGNVKAEAGSGDIEFRDADISNAVAKTGSGNVKFDRVKGSVEAHTGSGDIEVNGEPAGREWHMETGSGSIDLRIPDSVGFDLDASSSSGDIDVRRPITMQGKLEKHHIKGKVGNGGALLTLETGSGDIRID